MEVRDLAAARTSLTLQVHVLEMPLKERFTIATQSWDVAESVFVTVSSGEYTGIGEAQPAQRWDESIDTVVGQLESVDLDRLDGPFDLERATSLLPPGAARCALDLALHDLASQIAGVSLSEFLGLGGGAIPPTSVTIPIAPMDEMLERARALSNLPILKIKLGFDGDVEIVRAVRDVYPGRIRVDANEGWNLEQAKDRLRLLEPLEIELCEQPLRAGDPRGLREVMQATSIPIFADEDACTAQDVARLAGCVRGVNLKLRKAGGIRETVKAIAVARSQGLGVMLGCNLESGVATTAAAHVSKLVDHADLDAPLLLADDPFPGISYQNGSIALPHGPGLGVSRSTPW